MNANQEIWSVDDEDYRYDTLEELLESGSADHLRPGDTVYCGIIKHPAIEKLVNAGDIIEIVGDRAYDIGGEYADDYPDVTQEHADKLQKFLEQWLSDLPSPRFFEVVNVVPRILTINDFATDHLGAIAIQDRAAGVGKVLTPAAEHEAAAFNRAFDGGNCSCHISPPCYSCTHPGNPANQAEDETAWQWEDPAKALEKLELAARSSLAFSIALLADLHSSEMAKHSAAWNQAYALRNQPARHPIEYVRGYPGIDY